MNLCSVAAWPSKALKETRMDRYSSAIENLDHRHWKHANVAFQTISWKLCKYVALKSHQNAFLSFQNTFCAKKHVILCRPIGEGHVSQGIALVRIARCFGNVRYLESLAWQRRMAPSETLTNHDAQIWYSYVLCTPCSSSALDMEVIERLEFASRKSTKNPQDQKTYSAMLEIELDFKSEDQHWK